MPILNAFNSFSNKRIYSFMALLIIFLIGLYGSLKVTFVTMGVQPDTSHSAMLWYGLKDYGIGFITTWLFTPDNWLFSLVPLHFLMFFCFGTEPFLVILTGWLIFITSVILSGVIAKLLNAPKSAWIIPIVLIFSGLYAHSHGSISHPVSHNVTNLFGLFSFLLLLKWMKVPRISLLILIAISTIAAGVSDPWLIAAYTLPMTITSIIILFISKNPVERKKLLLLFFTMGFSLISIKTQLFATLSFLPTFNFQIASWDIINSNTLYLIKNLGGLLNLVPFNTSSAFFRHFPALLSLSIFLVLTLGLTHLIKKKVLPYDPLYFVFYSIIALSIGGVLLACLIIDVPGPGYSARFLINVLYLVVIGTTVVLELHWDAVSRVLKFVTLLVGIMFITSGVISNLSIWILPKIVVQDNSSHELIEFLSKNKLNYGYGPYWGSNSNAITWLSKSKIKIRPVVFDKEKGWMLAGYRNESSKLWYLPEDAPVNQRDYFVFLKSDGEECPDINLCINGLMEQFGTPTKIIPYKDSYILVWPHPLVGFISYKTYNIGENIVFTTGGDAFPWPGWSWPEQWGRWSDGDTSEVFLKFVSVPENNLELFIDGYAFVNEKHQTQEIDVLINQHLLSTLKYDLLSNGGRIVKVPKSLVSENKGMLHIQFKFKNPKSPAELGLSGDRRRLGLRLVSLRLETANK